MSEYLIQSETLTSIANEVRYVTGESDPLTLEQISTIIHDELVIRPSGNKSITATTEIQTEINVADFATVSVAPTPSESKTVTANGTVTPTSGKYLSSVIVAIPVYDGSVS